MKGLLLKDLCNLKGQLKMYLILPIMSIFFAIQMGSLTSSQAILGMLIVLVPISAFAYDEYSSFDSYALTLPLRRSDLVYSKYILSFLVGVVTFLVSLLLTFILYVAFGASYFEMDIKAVLLGQVLSVSLIFLMAAVLFPFLFKFGSNKGRMIMIVLFMSISLILYVLFSMNITISASIINFVQNNIIWIALIVCFVVLTISILSSLSIMNKKEF